MVWVIVVVGAIAVLAILGYLMGPQGGRSITRRDHRIVATRGERAVDFAAVTGQLAGVEDLAVSVVLIARERVAGGLSAEDALGKGFSQVTRLEREGPLVAAVASLLVSVGVMHEAAPAVAPMIPPPEDLAPFVARDAAAFVRLFGVRDLNAWP